MWSSQTRPQFRQFTYAKSATVISVHAKPDFGTIDPEQNANLRYWDLKHSF
jgi:hypothetical protein